MGISGDMPLFKTYRLAATSSNSGIFRNSTCPLCFRHSSSMWSICLSVDVSGLLLSRSHIVCWATNTFCLHYRLDHSILMKGTQTIIPFIYFTNRFQCQWPYSMSAKKYKSFPSLHIVLMLNKTKCEFVGDPKFQQTTSFWLELHTCRLYSHIDLWFI